MTKADASQPAIPPLPQAPKTLTLPTPPLPPRAPLAAQPRLPSLPAAREPATARSQPIAQSGTYSLGDHPRSASSTPPAPVAADRASTPSAATASASVGTHARTSIVVSAVTAALVSAITVVASSRARPSANAPAPARVTVPELARVPAENVRAIVEAMGLHANVEERPDPSVTGAGVVIAQAPRAGTTIERGSHVAIVLATRPSTSAVIAAPSQPSQPASSTATPTAPSEPSTGASELAGAEANAITVPSVLRMFAPEARARLASAGLTVRAVRESFDEDVGQNRVLRQVPAANARVPRGASVDLWVNRE